MAYEEFINFLQDVGKDPSRLIFEDELTGIHNRRFLLNYFEYKVPWDALDNYPLSILMMDVDYLKRINDSYGHDIGDQALIWIAGLLKEVADDRGLAIRYAGDEFVLLLPHTDKQEALQVGERLLQRLGQQPLRLGEGSADLHITLSMGIATAPDDAQTAKSLIQKADTALYYAKNSGRGGLANAEEMDLQTVWAKTVLHQLEGTDIAGRRLQLAQVEERFQRFSQGQNQFLIVQGAAGMGKSKFLETIRRSLPPGNNWTAKVNGIQIEAFRPYSLTTQIVVALVNQRQDKGAAVIESLSREEIRYLARILPQLGDTEELDLDEDERTQREGLFATLVHFIRKILGSAPLVLLIDDLHFADEATLLLLRRVMMRGEIPLFILGTSADTALSRVEEQAIPLEQFYSAEDQQLNISKIDLTPLSAADITKYLREILPGVRLPKNFGKDLAQITEGNPLFLVEILRKVVLDQKFDVAGQQWVLEPLEKGYLPRSLEEIVSQKIAALDEEGRQLLAQASTFGEDVSVSFLTGSSERTEARVLEFVDKAVAQGLLRSDFQLNDETIRFLGKRIQEITYGGIPDDHRQELHERIGNYQEALYQQRLLPSAATLAYHFKRSTDQEKARKYAQAQALFDERVFNAREAISYSGEMPSGGDALDIPLDPSSLGHIPAVIRLLLTGARNIRLYPRESKAIATVALQAKEAIDRVLAKNDRLNLVQMKGAVLVNGEKVDVPELKPVGKAFLDLLSRIELEGIAFHRGFTERELRCVVGALGDVRRKEIDRGFWQRFSSEQGLLHIKLKQVHYTEKTEPAAVSALLLSREQKLDQEDLPRIHEIIRWLVSAASNVKLYPSTSRVVSRSIEQLVEAVHEGLMRRPVLTLARVGRSLLVNGDIVDTSELKALADSFIEFLQSVGLSSLTFVEHASPRELQAFVEALKTVPATGVSSEFWKRVAEDRKLSRILFDHRVYEIEAMKDSGGQLGEELWGEAQGERGMLELPDPGTEVAPDAIADKVNGVLLRGNEREIELVMTQLFEGFHTSDPQSRRKIVDICRSSLERLPRSFQYHFIVRVANRLLIAFSEEQDSKILGEIAATLHRMAANLILFAEYGLASQILSHLHSRQRQLQEAKDVRAEILAAALDERLKLTTLKLIVEDLKGGEAARQRSAAQLLGSLGLSAVPVLIDSVKQTGELRGRQLAASLLAELGSEAADMLKRELVLEVSAHERIRILEIIDTVTHDLKTELTCALGDGDLQVREAAFRLAERLGDEEIVEVIVDYAKHRETDLATAGIRFLGKLKPAGAVGVLVSILNSTTETERVVACCQALGQIADPAAIEPLAKMLAPRSLSSLRRRWNAQVRATAAFALGQISHPGAAEALVPLADDGDPRVRKIARARLTQ